MKTGHIFWGTFLIVFGSLMLVNSMGGHIPNFEGILKFWPLLIVLWGLSMLKLSPLPKKILSGITALFMAIFFAAVVLFNWHWSCFNSKSEDCIECKYNDDQYSRNSLLLSKALPDSLKHAVLNINGGAAKFQVGGETSELIYARSNNPNHDFNIYEDTTKSVLTLSINDLHLKNIFHSGKHSRTAFISLNSKVSWDLNFDIGAAELKADLSTYLINNLDIDAGAASIKVKLGEISDFTNVRIDAGATSVELNLPKSVGCELESETGLSHVDFDGLTQSDGKYFSDNYQTSTKKVHIIISGGVSSFKVRRY